VLNVCLSLDYLLKALKRILTTKVLLFVKMFLEIAKIATELQISPLIEFSRHFKRTGKEIIYIFT